jgi:hypothetical protein
MDRLLGCIVLFGVVGLLDFENDGLYCRIVFWIVYMYYVTMYFTDRRISKIDGIRESMDVDSFENRMVMA